MTFVRRWMWPFYAFVYPLIFWPSDGPWGTGTLPRYFFAAIMLFIGIVVELASHPEVGFKDFKKVPTFARAHPTPFLLLAFGVWAVICALLAPQPIISLLGILYDGRDGALSVLMFCVIGFMVYLHTLEDNTLRDRIGWAIVAAAAVVGVFAVLESILLRGIFFNVGQGDLPLANFEQKGQLAGFMVMAFGTTAAVFALRSRRLFLGLALFFPFVIGITHNRSAFFAVLVAFPLLWLLKKTAWRNHLLLLITTLVAFLIGWNTLGNRISSQEGSTKASDTTTLSLRQYYWEASWNGTLARPIAGWGPAQFHYYWDEHLSEDKIADFIKREFFANDPKLIYVGLLSTDIQGKPLLPRLVSYRNEETGGYKRYRWLGWVSHNFVLDILINYGFIGLFILIFLGISLIKSVYLHEKSKFLGFVLHNSYLLLWFVPPSLQGVYILGFI